MLCLVGCRGNHPDSAQPATQPVPASQPARAASADQKLKDELVPMMALIRDRKTGPARVRLRNHLNLHPDDAQACFLFGLTYHREKKYGEARPWFVQALQKDPNYAVSHYFLGWTLYYLGELKLSQREFDAYLLTNPTEHDSHFALGLIRLDEDDLDGAERLFKQAIELVQQQEPDDKAALSRGKARLGEVYERQNRLNEARSELEQAVTIYPDHYEAIYRLYRVLMRMGETQQAEAVHKQYLATRERVRPGTSFPE